MFGRKQQPKDAVDVNDFIVNDSMQAGIHIGADLASPVHSVDIPDDEIIDADYAEPVTRKRLKTSQVLILGAVAVFAVGGVASIFVTPQTAGPNPVAATPQSPATVIAPEPAAKLPPGLADPDQVQPPANVPGPAASATGNVTPVPTDPLVSSSAPPAVPANLATTPSPAPVSANAAGVPPAPVAPAAVPVAVVAEPKAPPVASATVPSNPVTAQIAEAQKASPVTQPVLPAAQPKAPAVPPQAQSTPKLQQQHPTAAVPAAPKATPVPATPANADKKPVAAAKTVAPTQPKQVTTEHENSEEGIKRLVTTSAEAFGLQSIQEGAITLEGRRGNAPQRLRVGDRLPSGEQILRIDARSMTLVTDRSVIRLN